tara:strand:+ start:315 stop:944 length:630 start_codon:yes stop_codon:yes gene_type:complete
MINLTNEDNMELMSRYPNNYFELAIVDPPYGIDVNKMSLGDGAKKQKRHKEYKDNSIPKKEYFEELKRVSKNQIIWGGNYFLDYLNKTKCFLIWDKIQEFSGADFEMAWTSFNKVSKAFRFSRVEAYGKGTIHPTQKPVKLYEWLLMNYAKEGDKILDTHLGSGSIAIACHNLGFNLTGCELDTEYYEAACKRLKQHQAQLTIFNTPEK